MNRFFKFSNILHYFAFVVLIAFLSVFLLLPIYLVIREGLHWSLISEVFRNPVTCEGLINSLKIALLTTFFTILLAFPFALLFNKYDFRGKNMVSFFMLLPMILPPFVGALGIQQFLGHYGVVNTILRNMGCAPIAFFDGENKLFAVALIESLHLFPILYLNLVASLNSVDPSMEEAAHLLGAGKLKTFFKVTLPLVKNGLFAGCSIILIWSFTELGTPLMFGFTRTTPVQIFNGMNEIESNPLPYAQVAVMLIFSTVLYLIAKRMLRTGNAVTTKGARKGNSYILSGFKAYLPFAAFALLALLSLLPHIMLLCCAFSQEYYQTLLPRVFTLIHFEEALSNPIVIPSIVNSLRYALLATVIAVILGLSGALIQHKWRLKFGILADILCMLPLSVPGIVIAFGYIGMSTKIDWAQDFFNPNGNPLLLLGVAYAIRRIPYVIRSASSGLQQTPDDLEFAARNLGAGERTAFMRITFPIIGAHLLIGGLFAFSFSMLEVSDSLILAQKSAYYPITKALFELSQFLGNGPAIACAFGVWTMLFLGATLFLASALAGRKSTDVFKF